MVNQNPKITRNYHHYDGDVDELRFHVPNGADRSFTIIKAIRSSSDQSSSSAGIAILDNDNDMVVVDGVQADAGAHCPSMTVLMAMITTMTWEEFTKFCRKQQRFRNGIPDIDRISPRPNAGNPLMQAKLGLNPAPQSDARSELFRVMSDDPDTPYMFPPMSHDEMAEEICRHTTFVDIGGIRSRICWDIRMNFTWNRTGRLRNATRMSDDYDRDWRYEVEENPAILENAKNSALLQYLAPDCIILDLEEYPCQFGLAGENKGFLTLERFAGNSMSATRDIDLAGRILRLRDDELEALWAILRVMDLETSVEHRREVMEWNMHELRKAFECKTGETA